LHHLRWPFKNKRHPITYRIYRILIVNRSLREGVAALPYAEILNPMGEDFAEAAVRADTAVRPYAEDLDRVASFVIHPGTKKTTHALHRRFAVISGVSTADVIRLPNWAEFCIWDGFGMR
jgi:hypothetical protein